MSSTDALAGSLKDAGDAVDSASLMENVADKLRDGDVALIALVEEGGEAGLYAKLAPFKVQIVRFDAAAIAAEVEEAEKIPREMERQARQQLRETKKAEAKKNIEEWRRRLPADFEAFRAKLKKGEKVLFSSNDLPTKIISFYEESTHTHHKALAIRMACALQQRRGIPVQVIYSTTQDTVLILKKTEKAWIGEKIINRNSGSLNVVINDRWRHSSGSSVSGRSTHDAKGFAFWPESSDSSLQRELAEAPRKSVK